MKLDKHVVDMFTELTKPADDVKMEKTCYGTISVVDGTRYVKLDGSDLLVPAASTVKTSHGDRVTVLMKNHSLTITGNLTAPATDGEGGSSGEAGTAATIEVGTVTTGEAGSSASVTNSGTASAAVFDFVIPRGDKGEKGDTGPQGPQGEKGDTGTWDGTIPDHQHAVSDILNFPTSLPANGGNADTVDGLHANEIASNPNLLINPDFKINQRGYQIYHAYGGQPSTETEKFDADYFADGWKFMFGGETAEITNDGVTLTLVNNQGVQQRLNFDMLRSLRGKPVVFSIDWELESGNYANFAFRNGSTLNSIVSTSDIGRKSQHFTAIIPTDLSETDAHTVTISGDGIIKVYSVKMEVGSIATQFVPPSHATELLKIQAMDGTIPADTLDGKHASDFALKTDIPTSLPANGGIADTARQTVSPNAKAMLWEDSEGGNLHLISPDGNHEVEMDLYNNSFRMVFIDNGEFTLAADYNSTTKKFNINGNADTLDGKHAESFMQWLGYISDANFLNDANYKVDYHCNISDGTIIGLPAAAWYHIVYYMHSNTNGHGMQIAYPLNFDGATMIRRATGITWEAWRNVADGGNAATASHQIYHILGTGTDVLSYAASDICPYYVNTKVRIMHSPTCPTNYGYDAANNDFWYDIYKLDNSWVTIKAYDIRGNVEYINSRLNGTWTGWARCNDYGNADTVDGLHANEIASNPNLLINPDFRINQRGKSVYNGYGYTVDCWRCISKYGQVTVGDSGITISNTAGGECKIKNFIERDLTGKTITLSACIDGTVHKVSGVATTDMTTWSKQLKVYFDGGGGYILFGSHQASPPIFFVMIESAEGKTYNVQWVKLELGGIATPFTPTDPATELAKCQRYYQIRSTNYNSVVDLSPSMRITPTVTQIGSSRYAYSAEL